MRPLANGNFGFRVFRANQGHLLASLEWRQIVHDLYCADKATFCAAYRISARFALTFGVEGFFLFASRAFCQGTPLVVVTSGANP